MEKRAIGHLEVILSFIIFISAAGFILYVFGSSGNERLYDSSLEYTYDEVIKNISIEIQVYSVIINKSAIPSGVVAINLLANLNGKSVGVIDDSGAVLPSKIGEAGIVYVSSTNWVNSDLIKIYVGEDYTPYLPALSASGLTVDEKYYKISSVIKKKVVSEQKVLILNNSYWQDYSSVRDYFSLPHRTDFGFVVELSDNSKIEAKKTIPVGVDVYSDNKNVEYMKDNQINSAVIEVQVW